MVFIPKGTEVRDDAGKLLLTFVRDYTIAVGGLAPSSADVTLPDGEHPAPGSLVDPFVMKWVERLLEKSA